MSEEKAAEKACKLVICEDPDTGKITIRTGSCSPQERARLHMKMSEGVVIDHRPIKEGDDGA